MRLPHHGVKRGIGKDEPGVGLDASLRGHCRIARWMKFRLACQGVRVPLRARALSRLQRGGTPHLDTDSENRYPAPRTAHEPPAISCSTFSRAALLGPRGQIGAPCDARPLLAQRRRDVFDADGLDRDRRLGAAEPLRADHRHLGEPADPLHVVVDPVPIPALAEQALGREPAGAQREEPGLQDCGHLEVPVALGRLGPADPQYASAVVDVAYDPVGDLARADQ